MSIDDMEQDLLADYRELHDRLSHMIEGGRLREGCIPNDYRWLVETLTQLAADGDKLTRALEAEGGL